ncbi:MAG: molybdenum cofactor guanylyltransferase MobA [Burkholderiaceae bacterium]
MISRESITGVILAGGLGRRLSADGAGVAKGLVRFRDATLIDYVLSRFAPQVGHLLLNADTARGDYRHLGIPLIADLLPGHPGPLAGVHAALASADTRWLATAPCDTPFLPRDLVLRLADAIEAAPGTELALARTAQRRHPLCMLVHRRAQPSLRAYLEEGGRSVEGWVERSQAAWVTFDDEQAFTNINTLSDLNQHERPR